MKQKLYLNFFAQLPQVFLLLGVALGVMLVLFLWGARPAFALTITWDGGGSTNDWSECANWDNSNTCPGTSDVAQFNGTSTKDATIDASFGGTVQGLTIASGYSGTITQARSLTLSSAGFSQAAGTFTGASQNIDINGGSNGSFTVSGGSFTSTTGTLSIEKNFTISGTGSFAHNNGTVTFDGSGSSSTIDVVTTLDFYLFNVSKGISGASVVITSGDTIVVLSTFTHTNGFCDTGTVDARSTITIAATADGGTCVLDFGSAGSQTLTISSGGIAPHLRLDSSDDASDVITINGASTFNGLTVTAGFSGTMPFINSGNYAMTFGTAGFSIAASTIDATNWTSATFTGNFTISGTGAFNAPTLTTFSGTAVTQTIDVLTSQTFVSFTENKGSNTQINIDSADTLVITGTLTLTDGYINDGTIDARSTISQASTFDGGDAIIDFGSASSQTYTTAGGTNPILRINDNNDDSDSVVVNANTIFTGLLITSAFSDTFAFSNAGGYDITIAHGTFTQDGGTFSGGSYNMKLGGNFTKTGGTFTAPSTFTVINGGAATITMDVEAPLTFNAFTVNRPSGTFAIASADHVIVTGTLSFTDGAVASGTGVFEARGNVVVSSTIDGTGVALYFNGTSGSGLASQTFDLTGATAAFNSDISVDKSEGSVQLLSTLTMDAASQDLTLVEGKLDIHGQTLTVSGAGGTFVVQDGGNLQLYGSESVTVPTLNSGSIVTYTGDGGSDVDTYTITTLASTYSNLVINSTDGASDSFSLGAALTVNANLTITAGTLDANNSTPRNISLAGNWANTGTFQARSATVSLTGTDQQITGTTTFNNLTKTVTVARTLTFGATQTQTIAGTLTLTGQSGALLSLRSTSTNTQWLFDPQGTRTISYLDVKDSNNANATVMSIAGNNISNSGNNTNWGFNNDPGIPSGLGASNYTDGSWGTDNTPTLDFTLSDADGDQVKYRIQIDDSADFGSLVVDYTSALAAAGARSFTVGQAVGSGSYSTGTEGQTLSDSSAYYWRVKAIDASAAESSYATANAGAIAFKVDVTAPTAGSLGLNARTTTSITVEVSGASDATSGLAASPYNFSNNTAATSSGYQAGSTWASTSLSINTSYTFGLTTKDTATNTSSASTFTRYTLAAQPNSLVLTVNGSDSITADWGANSNPNGTEYYITNITAGTNSGWITTRTWNSTGLSANTEYFFGVKARNGDSVETTTTNGSATTTGANDSPDTPTSLGPAGLVNNLWTTDNTPTVQFALTDPDDGDTIAYRIQIDDTSNFGSPVVDYTSAYDTERLASFTVGQAAGSGSYTTGSASQTLADGSYYWRVKATDNSAAESSYATANGGAVAFKVDATAPTAGTLSLNTRTTTSITVEVSGASDAGSGLDSTPYNFSNNTAATSSGYQAGSTWASTSLSINTSYTFGLTTKDTATNTASASTLTHYTLAAVPTNLSISALSQTSVSASWDANGNPGGTEYYISNDTAGTNSGWVTDSFWTSTGLSVATTYSFTLRARNGDTAETATITGSGATSPNNAAVLLPDSQTLPKLPLVLSINVGAASTRNRNVILNFIVGENVTSVALSSTPEFPNSTIEDLSVNRLWTLCGEVCPVGSKTVYAKFYTKYGQQSPIVSASIYFDPEGKESPVSPLGSNVLDSTGTIYFLAANSYGQLERRPYTSAGAFLSYGFNSWRTVLTAKAGDLSLSVGEFIPPRDGKVVCSDRGVDRGTCYLITEGKRAGFTSEEVFTELGFSFAKSLVGDVSFLPEGRQIGSGSEAHRPGVLVNRGGTIYLVASGGLFGVPNMDILKSWGYALGDTVTANLADKLLQQTQILTLRRPGQLSP